LTSERSARAAAPAAATARALAAQVIARVLDEGRYLDTALEDVRSKQRDLSDWAMVQELSYGTLRWYQQLVGIAALFLRRPLKAKDTDLHALLLTGLYQLRHMRVPQHAAVDATVGAAEALGKPWAKSLINACLRSYLREPDRVAAALAASEELHFSHPSWLITALRTNYPDTWEQVLESNNCRPPMTLRVNTQRLAPAEYQARLTALGLQTHPHPQAQTALVLEEPMAVERLPGFSEGQVSVQDAAGQLAAVWLDPEPQQRVLDACAAPGGKTAHLLERVPTLHVTALDVDPLRLQRVQANLNRLGLTADVRPGDATQPAQWWDGHPYDRILVDAPCSATGVIRRHPDIKVRRRPEDLSKLLKTQAEILAGVWPCLARGGKLLYATCSVLSEENELQVRDFIAHHLDATALPLQPGTKALGYQILPGEREMDGFYYACLRKM
jgi:16S rRNA (cytosine967-C5)-methyltransferase